MKSRVMDHIRLIILFVLIFVILNERLTLLTISMGIVAAAISIWITNKILEIDYVEIFHINALLVLTYFWIILRDTYVVGWDTIVRTLKGNIKPNTIEYKTEIEDEFLRALFVNAITMPPGTIVVDREGEDLNILTVGFEKEQFKVDTKNQIEKLIKKFENDI